MKRQAHILFLLAAAITAGAIAVGSVYFAAGLFRDDKETEMRKAVASGACPGYVTYLLEAGCEEWSCVGWADVERRRQMDAHTVFRICSMTKSFVGALAAVLADRGDIALDEPVSRHFPEFTGEKAGITLRQCLSMSAGFEEMSPTMLERGVNSQEHDEVLREMAVLPLEAPPGIRFRYSNPSFEIAAAVMEKVTGDSLEDLLDETFFRPLGMTETTFHPTEEMLARLAVVYRMREDDGCERFVGPLVLRPPYEGSESHASACGGLFSTPLDMMRFYKMLLRGGLAEDGRCVMTKGAMALIETRQTPPSASTWYSLGFFNRDGWLGHGGAYGTLGEIDRAGGRMRMIFMQACGGAAMKFLRMWRKSTAETYDEVSLTGSRFYERE